MIPLVWWDLKIHRRVQVEIAISSKLFMKLFNRVMRLCKKSRRHLMFLHIITLIVRRQSWTRMNLTTCLFIIRKSVPKLARSTCHTKLLTHKGHLQWSRHKAVSRQASLLHPELRKKEERAMSSVVARWMSSSREAALDIPTTHKAEAVQDLIKRCPSSSHNSST
jgi:hypothetical protein